jgi:hypothetical protein
LPSLLFRALVKLGPHTDKNNNMRGGVVTNGPNFKTYSRMSKSEQQFFNRWITANSVLSSLIVSGIFALAIMGYLGVGGTEPAETTATASQAPRLTP